MDNDRIKHSLAVAKKMKQISKDLNMSFLDQKICYVIGLNHDIGYEFCDNILEHNIVGGNILKEMGFKYWKEVYYHGSIDSCYNSIYLDILNQADMQIDKYGNDVGYTKRLEDIKNRYGENSTQYLNAYKLIDKIKNSQ